MPTQPHPSDRPLSIVVLAMTADGKISDAQRSHPTFGSQEDYARLEQQVALADAVLFGAGTLQAGGTAMRVQDDALIQKRMQAGKPEQPIQMVCTRSGSIDPEIKFFQQSVPRYLLTTESGAKAWQKTQHFDQIIASPGTDADSGLDWHKAFAQLFQAGVKRIAVLGGGEIVAALLEANLIDELHLTLCPTLIGGRDAPTPVAGDGFTQDAAPQLELLDVDRVGQELFLHYRVIHPEAS